MFRYFFWFPLWVIAAQLHAQPVHDMRANATLISGTNLVITSSNEGATSESNDPLWIEEDSYDVGSTTVWWKWTPEFNGTATIATGIPEGDLEQNSNFDTQLGIYVVGTSGLREISSSEDAENLGVLSKVTFEAEAGLTYFIMVSGWDGDAGTVKLYLDQSAALAYQLSLNLNPFSGGTLSASPQSPGGTYPIGTTVTLTANPASGFEFERWVGDIQSTTNPVQLTINSNTQITALFRSTSAGLTLNVAPGEGGQVSVDTPPNATGGTYAPNTRVTITATPALNFRFDSWSGTFVPSNNPLTLLVTSNINVTANFSTTLPPVNDNFENAILLEGTNIVATGNNNNATMQSPPEPLAIDFTPSSGNSVWWRWIAPLSGSTTIATGVPGGSAGQQSAFDTLLGVYTGSTRSNLAHVASSDDADEFPAGSGLSLVKFEAVAGQTYQILVDSYTNRTGQISLYITNTIIAAEPPVLSISRQANSVRIEAANSPETVHTLEASPNLINWQFYSFITNSAGPVVVDTNTGGNWLFFRIKD